MWMPIPGIHMLAGLATHAIGQAFRSRDFGYCSGHPAEEQ